MPVKPRSQVFDHPLVKREWKNIWIKRETNLREKAKYQMEKLSQGTKILPLLHPGDICRVQNQTGRFPRRWDRHGQIIKQGAHNQYVVKLSGSNRLTLRNRKFLRKIISPPTNIHMYPDNFVGENQGIEKPVDITPSPPIPDPPISNVVHPPELPVALNDDAVIEHTQPTTHDADETDHEAPHQAHEGLDITNEHTEENNHRTNVVVTTRNRPSRTRDPPSWHKDYKMGAFTNC